MTLQSKESCIVKIFTLFIMMKRFFTMSLKYQLVFWLKMHDLSYIMYVTYQGLKSKINHGITGSVSQHMYLCSILLKDWSGVTVN